MSGTDTTIACNNIAGYFPFSNDGGALCGSGPWNTATELDIQTEIYVASSFSMMSVCFAGTSAVFHFRRNSINGNQIVSGTSATPVVVTDVTHSDGCFVNDLLNYIGETPSNIFYTSGNLNAATPYSLYGAGYPFTSGSGNVTFPTTANYGSLIGSFTNGQLTSSSSTQQTIEAPGVASNFAITIPDAPSGTVTANVQIGGSIGNQVISTTGTSGIVTDTTHTDAFAKGNVVDQKIVSTSAVGTYRRLSISLANTTSAQDVIASENPGVSQSGPYYFMSGGINSAASATQGSVSINYAATASLLRLTSDNVLGAGNVVSYINNVTGNQIVSYTGSNGTVVDVTHSDTVATGNPIACQFNSSTPWYFASGGMTLNDNSFVGLTNSFGAVF